LTNPYQASKQTTNQRFNKQKTNIRTHTYKSGSNQSTKRANNQKPTILSLLCTYYFCRASFYVVCPKCHEKNVWRVQELFC